jgi:hypothetical protein
MKLTKSESMNPRIRNIIGGALSATFVAGCAQGTPSSDAYKALNYAAYSGPGSGADRIQAHLRVKLLQQQVREEFGTINQAMARPDSMNQFCEGKLDLTSRLYQMQKEVIMERPRWSRNSNEARGLQMTEAAISAKLSQLETQRTEQKKKHEGQTF